MAQELMDGGYCPRCSDFCVSLDNNLSLELLHKLRANPASGADFYSSHGGLITPLMNENALEVAWFPHTKGVIECPHCHGYFHWLEGASCTVCGALPTPPDRLIRAPHEPFDEVKVASLVEMLPQLGSPIIRVAEHDNRYLALEGSHRLRAAEILQVRPELIVLQPNSRMDWDLWAPRPTLQNFLENMLDGHWWTREYDFRNL